MQHKFYIAVLVSFVSCTLLRAQGGHLNFMLGVGPSYSFNEPKSRRYLDNGFTFGINYLFNKKNRAFIFNPGLNLQFNRYHASLISNRVVHVHQFLYNLTLDMLMRVNKKNYLRVGLLYNKEMGEQVFIIQKDGTSNMYYGYGSSEIEKNYVAANFQAAIKLGFDIPFELLKREHKFCIHLVHFVSPLVGADYTLTKKQVGADLTVISGHARPTMLIFSIEFNLKGRVRVKDPEED